MVTASSTSSSGVEPAEDVAGTTPSQPLQQQPADGADAMGYIDETDGRRTPLRSMSSFRARLRQGRREVGGPVPLFQWETRGHFWSELDKGAAPRDPLQARSSGRLTRWGRMANVRLKNTATVIRLRPSVLLWPVLLCAVCVGLGILGIELGARHYTGQNKDEAQAVATQAVDSYSLALGQTLQPLRLLELPTLLRPAMAELGPRFPSIAQQLLEKALPALGTLLLSPFGVVRAVYPSPPPQQSSPLGTDLLPAARLQPALLQHLILGSAAGIATPGAQQQLFVANKPVLISGVGPDEGWGNGPGPNGTATANCSGCYYDSSDGGTRLWGFASALVDASGLADVPSAGLQQLRELGYLYRLTLLADDLSTPLAVLNSNPQLPSGAQVVGATAPVDGASATLQLDVYPEQGWEPAWRAPLIAVVAVVSVVMSMMLFAALVLQHRYVMLLEAMLPKKVLKVLRTGRSFYEHYDSVTVLYADIVRYSNAPTGMPAWEVVKLLDDVNNIYDNLLNKHGLIKIRRSGEAFMGVGGCPNAEDPVATAVRVAMCAREMVLATAAFRSSAGQRVQIRLGLHSGPVVAAVLGTIMPRFSLLGDTIDIAHFMESTSTIMGVHVSDTTAELLAIADDPLIVIQPRGIIDIKGRGPITTSWLRIDLFVPMTTFHDHTGNSTNNAAAGGYDAGGSTRNGSAGGAANGGGGSAAQPAASPSDIACTADLAVAATLGVRGAPLVRKLSQTGLTQTRRALPDRRQREVKALESDNSLLGSFVLHLEPDTISMVKMMLARPSPQHSRKRVVEAVGTGAGAGAAVEGAGAAPAAEGGGAGGEGEGKAAAVTATDAAVAEAAAANGVVAAAADKPYDAAGANGVVAEAAAKPYDAAGANGVVAEAAAKPYDAAGANGVVAEAAAKPYDVAQAASLEIEVG